MSEKLKVGVLGATGMVGQRFVTLLENHPWFELVTVAASAHSAGKTYEEAVGDRWKMETPMPEFVKNMVVKDVSDVENVAKDVDFVFSAVNMSKDEIRAIEEEYAKTETPVVSNNSAHRWTPDVPMVIPEINPQHYEVIKDQRKRLGTTRGFIAVKPNCSIQAYTPCLAAWMEFEPREVIVSTYQAISGAGKTFKDWPEMIGNIIPFISGEEEKSEQEPLKVFGHIEDGKIVKLDNGLRITSQCIRVPVLNGHTATVFVNFAKKPTKEQLACRTPPSSSSNTARSPTVRRSSSTWIMKAAWASPSAVCARIPSSTGSSSAWRTTRCAVPPAARSKAPRCSRRSVISPRSKYHGELRTPSHPHKGHARLCCFPFLSVSGTCGCDGVPCCVRHICGIISTE